MLFVLMDASYIATIAHYHAGKANKIPLGSKTNLLVKIKEPMLKPVKMQLKSKGELARWLEYRSEW